jgi:hypothetical protein
MDLKIPSHLLNFDSTWKSKLSLLNSDLTKLQTRLNRGEYNFHENYPISRTAHIKSAVDSSAFIARIDEIIGVKPSFVKETNEWAIDDTTCFDFHDNGATQAPPRKKEPRTLNEYEEGTMFSVDASSSSSTSRSIDESASSSNTSRNQTDRPGLSMQNSVGSLTISNLAVEKTLVVVDSFVKTTQDQVTETDAHPRKLLRLDRAPCIELLSRKLSIPMRSTSTEMAQPFGRVKYYGLEFKGEIILDKEDYYVILFPDGQSGSYSKTNVTLI